MGNKFHHTFDIVEQQLTNDQFQLTTRSAQILPRNILTDNLILSIDGKHKQFVEFKNI